MSVKSRVQNFWTVMREETSFTCYALLVARELISSTFTPTDVPHYDDLIKTARNKKALFLVPEKGLD